MAATTINPRPTWTDDTGSSDGTVINNARLQADIYDVIDDLIANNIVFGGTLSTEGFGVHSLSAGGTGGNSLAVRNTSAGTTNFGQLSAQADGTGSASLQQFSTTFVSSGSAVASGSRVNASGSGGLSISAAHASGMIRTYTGGTTERLRIRADGVISIGTDHTLTTGLGFGSMQLVGITPGVELHETDAAADNRRWRITMGSGAWVVQALNDALNVVDTAINITRSGAAVSEIQFGGTVRPDTDDTLSLGTSAFRWSETWGGIIHANDVVLDNDFRITEHDKVGIATPGVAFTNPNGEVILFVDAAGTLYVHETRSLADLGRVASR